MTLAILKRALVTIALGGSAYALILEGISGQASQAAHQKAETSVQNLQQTQLAQTIIYQGDTIKQLQSILNEINRQNTLTQDHIQSAYNQIRKLGSTAGIQAVPASYSTVASTGTPALSSGNYQASTPQATISSSNNAAPPVQSVSRASGAN